MSNKNKTNNDLKPCPFCGSENLAEEASGSLEIYGSTFQSAWIECLDCGCEGPRLEITDSTNPEDFKENTVSDYQAVRDNWNKRATIN